MKGSYIIVCTFPPIFASLSQIEKKAPLSEEANFFLILRLQVSLAYCQVKSIKMFFWILTCKKNK